MPIMPRRATTSAYRDRVRVLKALAHPSRLLIVDTLAGGERTVREITEVVGSDMSTVSKHLGILRNAGVVSDQKRGTSVYYWLRCRCVLSFFKCTDTVLKTAVRDQMHVIAMRGE